MDSQTVKLILGFSSSVRTKANAAINLLTPDEVGGNNLRCLTVASPFLWGGGGGLCVITASKTPLTITSLFCGIRR